MYKNLREYELIQRFPVKNVKYLHMLVDSGVVWSDSPFPSDHKVTQRSRIYFECCRENRSRVRAILQQRESKPSLQNGTLQQCFCRQNSLPRVWTFASKRFRIVHLHQATYFGHRSIDLADDRAKLQRHVYWDTLLPEALSLVLNTGFRTPRDQYDL